jgi:hypothetical protein
MSLVSHNDLFLKEKRIYRLIWPSYIVRQLDVARMHLLCLAPKIFIIFRLIFSLFHNHGAKSVGLSPKPTPLCEKHKTEMHLNPHRRCARCSSQIITPHITIKSEMCMCASPSTIKMEMAHLKFVDEKTKKIRCTTPSPSTVPLTVNDV